MSSSFIEGTMLEMTWVEIDEHAKKDAIVIFPAAVVEEHGPHMTVATDIIFSYVMAREAQKLFAKKGVDSIIAPPFYWGINGTTKDMPGSFNVSNETCTAMLVDIFMSLKKWGFRKILAIPGHGENDHLRCIDKALGIVYERTGPGGYVIMTSLFAQKAGIQPSNQSFWIPD